MRLTCCRCHSLGPDLPGVPPDTPFSCRNCTPRPRRGRRLKFGYQEPPRPPRGSTSWPKQTVSDVGEVWTEEDWAELQTQRRLAAELRERKQREQRQAWIDLLRIFGDWSGLSTIERDIFYAHLVEGKSVREVAASLGLSKSEVHRLAKKAFRTLAKTVRPMRQTGRPEFEALWKGSDVDHDEDWRDTYGRPMTYEQVTGVGLSDDAED